jgi:hypothetical protein
VSGPTAPSTGRPDRFWKKRTASFGVRAEIAVLRNSFGKFTLEVEKLLENHDEVPFGSLFEN